MEGECEGYTTPDSLIRTPRRFYILFEFLLHPYPPKIFRGCRRNVTVSTPPPPPLSGPHKMQKFLGL